MFGSTGRTSQSQVYKCSSQLCTHTRTHTVTQWASGQRKSKDKYNHRHSYIEMLRPSSCGMVASNQTPREKKKTASQHLSHSSLTIFLVYFLLVFKNLLCVAVCGGRRAPNIHEVQCTLCKYYKFFLPLNFSTASIHLPHTLNKTDCMPCLFYILCEPFEFEMLCWCVKQVLSFVCEFNMFSCCTWARARSTLRLAKKPRAHNRMERHTNGQPTHTHTQATALVWCASTLVRSWKYAMCFHHAQNHTACFQLLRTEGMCGPVYAYACKWHASWVQQRWIFVLTTLDDGNTVLFGQSV